MAADAAQLRAQRRALEHFVREGLIGGLSAAKDGVVHFLQIGGNDGVVADPLRHWHAREPWRGTIVEPVPAYFEKLSNLHASNPRMHLVNCAVSDQSGEMTLWHVEPREAAAYPAWTQGLASTDRQHLVRHNVSPDHCASVVVPCVTPEALCRTAGISALDLLCVDVEGHELAILQAFPFEAVPVTVTIFEAWHMPPPARTALAASLQPAGMVVVYLGEDGVIVSSGDDVRRAFLEQLALYLTKFDTP
jgi:FkbM family methyltransferase